jgi:hypothetical protein
MSSLVFLAGALLVIGIGTAVLLLRAREPKGFDSGIKGFQREMKALAPEPGRVVVVERTAEPVPARPTVIERRVLPPSDDVEPALVIEPSPEIVVDVDPEPVDPEPVEAEPVDAEPVALEPEPERGLIEPEPVEVPGSAGSTTESRE